jgi:hypothetical protein
MKDTKDPYGLNLYKVQTGKRKNTHLKSILSSEIKIVSVTKNIAKLGKTTVEYRLDGINHGANKT